jgi:hypothetical protein
MRQEKIIFFIYIFFLCGCFVVPRGGYDIFANAEYKIGNEYGIDVVKLVNGEYYQEHILHVRYEGQHVWGDFNHDGLKDAVVVVWESGGGSACWFELAFFINDGKKLVHQSTQELGNRARINSIVEKDGKVIVDMWLRPLPQDLAEGKMRHVVKTYEYKGPDKWGPTDEGTTQNSTLR